MKGGKILGIFALVLVITSIMKIAGLSFSPITDAYTTVATIIVQWYMPEIFSGAYPESVQTLAIFTPLVLTTSLILLTIQLTKSHRKSTGGN